jgi:hypothetical protein
MSNKTQEENKKPNKYLVAIASAIGALLFRIRGGLLDVWENKIWYPIFIGICYGYLAFINSALVWAYSLLGLVAAYIAQQCCGWGAYRGSLVAGATPASEVAIIDKLLAKSQWLLSHPRLCGFVGCSLRGLISSLCFGLVSQSIPVALCGLAVGICYAIPTALLWFTKYHNTKAAWNLGEYLEGALYVVAILLWSNIKIFGV